MSTRAIRTGRVRPARVGAPQLGCAIACVIAAARQQQQQQAAEAGWRKVFGIDGDWPSLLRCMAMTMELAEQVHREVMVLEDRQNVQLVLRNYWQVVAMTNNFPNITQHGLQGFLQPLDDRGELSLEQCEDMLTRWSWESTLDSGRIAVIRTQLKELREAVREADAYISGFDRDYILRVLNEMDLALAAYKIAGIEVVQKVSMPQLVSSSAGPTCWSA